MMTAIQTQRWNLAACPHFSTLLIKDVDHSQGDERFATILSLWTPRVSTLQKGFHLGLRDFPRKGAAQERRATVSSTFFLDAA